MGLGGYEFERKKGKLGTMYDYKGSKSEVNQLSVLIKYLSVPALDLQL